MRFQSIFMICLILVSRASGAEVPFPPRVIWEYPPSQQAGTREYIEAVAALDDGGVILLVGDEQRKWTIRRLDAQSNVLWMRPWDALAGLSSPLASISVLDNEKVGLAASLMGASILAAIGLDGERFADFPTTVDITIPTIWLSDGRRVSSCNYYNNARHAIPCIDSHNMTGWRQWLWQDNHPNGDLFVNNLSSRLDGGVAAVVAPDFPARLALPHRDADPKGKQYLYCFDVEGTLVGKTSVDSSMLQIDMTMANDGRIVLASWTNSLANIIRVIIFDGKDCHIKATHDTTVNDIVGNAPISSGRLLAAKDGSVILTFQEAKDEDGPLATYYRHTFAASVLKDGALHSLNISPFDGGKVSISRDGHRLLTISKNRVLGYRLDR